MAGPDGTATLIDQLRAGGTALIYDPVGRTLRAGGHDAPSVTSAGITDAHTGTRERRNT